MHYIFEQIKVGDLNTNCYIFGDTNTKDVVIVDPGDEADKILGIISRNNYKVKYILLTHGHFDHICAVKEIKEATKSQILIHELDSQMLTSSQKNLSTFKGVEVISTPPDVLLYDGDNISIGGLTFSIIHTPGHSNGGICVLFEDILFSGDTLFMGTIGRTDLPDSNYSDIINSVNILMKLDDKIKVYPGHGLSTTIGYERNNNTFIK